MFKRYKVLVEDGQTVRIDVSPSNAFWADQVENDNMHIWVETEDGLTTPPTQWKDRMGCRLEYQFTAFYIENKSSADKTVLVYIGNGWMWLGAP